MTQVTNQTELLTALTTLENDIQVSNDFEITRQININYEVTISSFGAGSFRLIKSASFFGNVFRIQNSGNLILTNIIIDGNKDNHSEDNTTNRSLILMTGGTLQLQENSVIENNFTYLEGGGVYLSGNLSYENHFLMSSNAIIRGCKARTNGGGIIAAFRNNLDSITIGGNAEIRDNDANYGGGIYYRIYENNVSNTSTISGNTLFINNSARNSGGAIAVLNTPNNPSAITLQILDSVSLRSNNATNHGGGLYFLGTNPRDSLSIATANITTNIAGGNGGGIYLNNALATLIGTRITNNQASTGGGLFDISTIGGMLQLTSAIIDNNQATNNQSGSGGGIWINNRSTIESFNLKFNDTSIQNNEASMQGGGLYFLESAGNTICEFNNVTVANNNARTNGGGMLLGMFGPSNINFQDCNIFENNSQNYGGGIYISNEAPGTATVNFTNTNIYKNEAREQGGGLRLSSGRGTQIATLENCNITENISQQSSGGGIWCGGTNVFLNLLQNTIVSENETLLGNGGGIYFNSDNGILNLRDYVKINNNLANKGNPLAGNSGGGICMVPGTLNIEDNVEIFSNQALKGGAISCSENATINLISGTIFDNSSIIGGGVYLNNGTLTNSGGSIYNNRANIGGGIYNAANLYLKEPGKIYNNTASEYANGIYNESNFYIEGYENIENGVYITSREATIKITENLGNNSIIQIDNSNYVYPDVAQALIVIAEATSSHPVLTENDLSSFQKPLEGFEDWKFILTDSNTKIVLVPLEVYTISYLNLQGATHNNPLTYTSNTPTITLLPPTPLKCKQFLGWYNEANQNQREIKSGSVGNITLVAQWDNLGSCKIGYVCCQKRPDLQKK